MGLIGREGGVGKRKGGLLCAWQRNSCITIEWLYIKLAYNHTNSRENLNSH